MQPSLRYSTPSGFSLSTPPGNFAFITMPFETPYDANGMAPPHRMGFSSCSTLPRGHLILRTSTRTSHQEIL